MRNWLTKNPSVIVTIVAMLLAFASGYGAFTMRISAVEVLAAETKKELKIECNRSMLVDSDRNAQMVGLGKDISSLNKSVEELKKEVRVNRKTVNDKLDNLKDLILKNRK